MPPAPSTALRPAPPRWCRFRRPGSSRLQHSCALPHPAGNSVDWQRDRGDGSSSSSPLEKYPCGYRVSDRNREPEALTLRLPIPVIISASLSGIRGADVKPTSSALAEAARCQRSTCLLCPFLAL